VIFPRPCFHLGLPGKPVATWGLGIAVIITDEPNPEYGLPAHIPADGEAANRVIEILPGVLPDSLPQVVDAESLEPVGEATLEVRGKDGVYKLAPVKLYRRKRGGLDRLSSGLPKKRDSGPPKRDC